MVNPSSKKLLAGISRISISISFHFSMGRLASVRPYVFHRTADHRPVRSCGMPVGHVHRGPSLICRTINNVIRHQFHSALFHVWFPLGSGDKFLLFRFPGNSTVAF